MTDNDRSGSLSHYIAVVLSECVSEDPSDAPLYEETFVLLRADSIRAARDQALDRVSPLSYENVRGRRVTWSRRLVEVGEIVDDTFHDGSGLYSRFFRNGAAYHELDFEDFRLAGPGA